MSENKKNEKLTDNKELMEVMSAAGDDDYSEAAKRIEKMENPEQPASENDDDYQTQAEKLLQQYEEEKQGVYVEYDLDADELEDAVRTFQKKTIYKKNIIYTILLGVISICFGVSAYMAPENIMNYIVFLGCLFIIFLLWNLPHRHIKAVKAANSAVKETFSAYVFDDCLFAGGGQSNVTHVPFGDKSFVVETKSGFVIGADRERLFLLPYRCLDSEKTNSLRNILKSSFKDRYENKNEVNA